MLIRELTTRETFREVRDLNTTELLHEHIQTHADVVCAVDKLMSSAKSPEHLQQTLTDFINEQKDYIYACGFGVVHLNTDTPLW